MLGDCLYIAIPRRKSHFKQNMIRASLGSWCSYTGMAEFSEITSWCSHRLLGWLGTIFKSALLDLMQSLKRQNMSDLKLFTTFPPHWSAWLTQHIQTWNLVLSFPYCFSKRMYLFTFFFYVFTFTVTQMHDTECKCCNCEFFFFDKCLHAEIASYKIASLFNKEKKLEDREIFILCDRACKMLDLGIRSCSLLESTRLILWYI